VCCCWLQVRAAACIALHRLGWKAIAAHVHQRGSREYSSSIAAVCRDVLGRRRQQCRDETPLFDDVTEAGLITLAAAL
jgi:CxxC motif-containing protein (DUF1111 family)